MADHADRLRCRVGIPFILIGGALGQMQWNLPFYVIRSGIPWHSGCDDAACRANALPVERMMCRSNSRGGMLIGFYGIAVDCCPVPDRAHPVAIPADTAWVTAPLTIAMGNMAQFIRHPVGSLYFKQRADRSVWSNLAFAFAFIGAACFWL